MRIAWVTSGISANEKDFTGAAAIANLIKGFSGFSDLEVVVFSLYYPINKPQYKLYNAKVYSFGKSSKLSRINKLQSWRNCVRQFKREHNEKKFEIIHSMWAGESGYVSAKLSRRFGVPLIANINGGELGEIREINFGSRLRFFQKYFVDKTFHRANTIVCGSDYISSKVEENYGKEITSKLKKVPFGIDAGLFKLLSSLNESATRRVEDMHPSPRRGGVKAEYVLISVANVVPVKSHFDLLRAFKIVLRKIPDFKLICCGRDEKKLLAKLVNELGISGKVELRGFVDYESLPALLNSAHLFVSGSLYESQNMSLLEAAFCGLPVVSTDVGVAPEITENIAKAGDYKSLAEKIIFVLENYEEQKRKAVEKVKNLQQSFSLESSAKKFRQLYDSLINVQQ